MSGVQQPEPRGALMRAHGVSIRRSVKILLRDGVRLNVTCYLPQHQPAPVILTMTPYIADSYHDRGMFFAKAGLAFLIVDVRGRGNSEGDFAPSIQEAKDGFDVVEWIAAQDFCNGKVAMWGGSYSGAAQWAVAKELPPHLATIVPVAASCQGVDFPMRNNIFWPYAAQWLTYVSGCTLQGQTFGDTALWFDIFRDHFLVDEPLSALSRLLDDHAAEVFGLWIAHPERDDFWDSYSPSEMQYAAIRHPVLTITGIFDGDQAGALHYYKHHLEAAAENHYLVIGPWDHAGTRTPQERTVGLHFGKASLLDINQLHLDWYKWAMGAGTKPVFLKSPVAYYVLGAEKWRYASTLASVTKQHAPYYLASSVNPIDIYTSGSLDVAPKGGPDHYTHDPLNVRAWADAGEGVDATHVTTFEPVSALAGRQLVYHSAPFVEATEISGFFRLSAWIAIDTPDTDFYITVYEIGADGTSILLAYDMMRARYRQSDRVPCLVDTTEPLLYEFKSFNFVSRQVKCGSRLRLVIAPLGRVVAFWFPQKNYQGGGVVAAETAADARTVTVSLFHDEKHPSALHVPFAHLDGNEDQALPDAVMQAPGTANG
ncbi:MAG: CocE/NonD family hydrolase [Proteobacteria bacterium]|nr:CocE/NonD family hydrolase [Pseudomonadota bacterium]